MTTKRQVKWAEKQIKENCCDFGCKKKATVLLNKKAYCKDHYKMKKYKARW